MTLLNHIGILLYLIIGCLVIDLIKNGFKEWKYGLGAGIFIFILFEIIYWIFKIFF